MYIQCGTNMVNNDNEIKKKLKKLSKFICYFISTYKQNTIPSAVGAWCRGSSAQCTFFFSTFDADDNNKNPKHTDYNL